MAVFDHFAAERNRKINEAYDKLKEEISTPGEDGKLPEQLLALEKLKEMESTIESQQKRIEEYQKFFNMLDSFLPHRPSVHDIIG